MTFKPQAAGVLAAGARDENLHVDSYYFFLAAAAPAAKQSRRPQIEAAGMAAVRGTAEGLIK